MAATERMLTIAHVDAEQGFSGGEVQVFLLMEGLRRRGHQNLLIAPPGSECTERAVCGGFEARPVAMHGDLDVAAVFRLRRELKSSAPDIVHLHTGRATWLGGLAARMAALKAITTRRMDRRVKRNWRTRLIYGHLVERAVAISPAVSRRLAEGGVAKATTATIPSAVDPERLRVAGDRASHRAALGIDGDEPVLLTLASLVERKGVDVLVEAVALLARSGIAVLCLVGGDGPERPRLERLAHERGVAHSIRFLGHRDDKPELLAACDVFVLPSRREGLGVASLEAMAAGRAVVASRVGGLAEAVVEGRTGLHVEPGDPEALADTLRRVLQDDALRERLAAAGPARVADGHTAEQMVVAYERLYREVLTEEGAR